MKKSIIAISALVMLLLGSTVMPAEARWHGGWGYPGYYGYGYHHHDIGSRLGWGLAGLGIGLGLGALGSRAYYNPYYDNYPVNVYSAPSYGYGGYYWY